MPLTRLALIASLALALSACNEPSGAPPGATAEGPAQANDTAASTPSPAPADSDAPSPGETPPPTPEDDSMSGPCNAEAASAAIGQVATPDVIEQARKDAGARMARTLAPDQMVTMEYLEGRLNIKVDDNNVVTGLTCG